MKPEGNWSLSDVTQSPVSIFLGVIVRKQECSKTLSSGVCGRPQLALKRLPKHRRAEQRTPLEVSDLEGGLKGVGRLFLAASVPNASR